MTMPRIEPINHPVSMTGWSRVIPRSFPVGEFGYVAAMESGVGPFTDEVTAKVRHLRNRLLEKKAELICEPPSIAKLPGWLPHGTAISADDVLTGYVREIAAIDAWDSAKPDLHRFGLLAVPDALVELYRITNAPYFGGVVELFSPPFRKGEIMDADGDVHREDEHWLSFGMTGTNDYLLISLTNGEVMLANHYFWRYGEQDNSRILAPDALTFFNEFLVGARFRELLEQEQADDPEGWLRFLQDNGFA
ncbi:SMI1/KNR4 family protein [Nocardia sp. NPDC003693]